MKILVALLSLSLLTVSAGCGRSSSASQAEKNYGQIDTTLSPELQAKQEAVKKALIGLQTGTLVSGVSIQGRIEPFLDDAGRMARWDFDGPPNGNEVPVVLYLQEQAGGKIASQAAKPVKRVYVVTGGKDRIFVARK